MIKAGLGSDLKARGAGEKSDETNTQNTPNKLQNTLKKLNLA